MVLLIPLLPQVPPHPLPVPFCMGRLVRNSLCPALSFCLSSHSSLISGLLGCQRMLLRLHSLCQTASAFPFVLTLAPTIQHCRPPEKYRDIAKRSKQSNSPWKGVGGKMHLHSSSNQHKKCPLKPLEDTSGMRGFPVVCLEWEPSQYLTQRNFESSTEWLH